MKKFFNVFFVTLGVIFFIIILIGVYLFVADPYHIKPMLFGSKASTAQTDKSPLLNASQEKALETFGIDPATIPSQISPQQEACFVKILGQVRVNEIKAGGSPTAAEYFQARGCI